MSQAARVESIEKLKDLRVALCLFAETARTGLLEADSEIQRTGLWLKNEQLRYWKSQIVSRSELFTRAKIALNQKKLTKTPLGGHYSCVDEEKAVQLARRRLEEAQTKLGNVQKWNRRLDEEVFEYKGQVQALGRMVDSEVPAAIARLDRMIESLESYMSLKSAAGEDVDLHAAFASVARGGEPGELLDSPWPESRAAAYAELRKLSPSAEVRQQAPAGSIPQPLAGRIVSQADRDGIAGLDITRTLPSPDSRLVFAVGCDTASHLYVERVEPAGPDDSGWYLGPVEGDPPDRFQALQIGQLLAQGPQWASILDLPVGTLLVLRAESAEALLDDRGTILWPGPTESADKRRQP
ncbi:MAG: hypothetical protein GX616_11410 [Planctomycetes bacterium]|nr:hypothetical protein [Planctomycetota bacterium]